MSLVLEATVERCSHSPAQFLVDQHGQVASWSSACASLWSYSELEALHLPLASLLTSASAVSELVSLSRDKSHQEAASILCRDGSSMPASLTTETRQVGDQCMLSCTVDPTAPATHPGRAALTLTTILEGLPCLFYIIDIHGHLLVWNEQLSETVERPSAELLNADVMSFFDTRDHAAILHKIKEAYSKGHSSHEAVIVGANGRQTPCLFHCARTMLGGDTCLFGTGIDISGLKETELRLLVTERAMDACVDAIVITRRDGAENLIEYVNPAFTRLSGYDKEESMGRDPAFMHAGNLDLAERDRVRRAILAEEGVHAVIRNRHKNGSIFWNDMRIDPVVGADGSVTHFVAVIHDVTQARKSEAELRYLATHDQLTGLANRAVLHDQLKLAIEHARRKLRFIAVVYLDMDNFKTINDSCGHDAGDLVLKGIARRFSDAVRRGDLIARLGGDEFVAVINDCDGADHVGELVERLHRGIIEPIDIPDKQILPSVSIGVSLFPHDGRDHHAILRAADAAMYRAKTSGKNQYKFYAPEMDLTVHNYLERETSLRHAIERNELFLCFQPKVDLKSGRMIGAEALVRWDHPKDGLLMPVEFIRMAEECGLIVPLGEWVLKRACAAIRDIHRAGFGDFTMSVNLSARQLRRPDFVDSVERLLADFGIGHGAIELEVTESQLMDNPDQAVLTLDRLKALGVALSIDDFGTGYSSLRQLQRFPVDFIKIDRAFLVDLDHRGDSMIAQTIISMGHNLDMKVIAEGVESEEQLHFLRHHHCDHIQGNYFSPAVSQHTLLGMLSTGAGMH
ncbi:MAG: EAL domain-containing protein [Pseudomonadota bacterium]